MKSKLQRAAELLVEYYAENFPASHGLGLSIDPTIRSLVVFSEHESCRVIRHIYLPEMALAHGEGPWPQIELVVRAGINEVRNEQATDKGT